MQIPEGYLIGVSVEFHRDTTLATARRAADHFSFTVEIQDKSTPYHQTMRISELQPINTHFGFMWLPLHMAIKSPTEVVLNVERATGQPNPAAPVRMVVAAHMLEGADDRNVIKAKAEVC